MTLIYNDTFPVKVNSKQYKLNIVTIEISLLCWGYHELRVTSNFSIVNDCNRAFCSRLFVAGRKHTFVSVCVYNKI